MASSTLPSIGLVSLILFVLPGLAGIKLALRLSKRGDWLNRVDTVVASVGLAVSSLVGFYLIESVMISLLALGFDRRVRTMRFNDVAKIAGNLDMLFLSYLIVFMLNILGGFLLYHTDFLYGKFSSNRTWKAYDRMVSRVDDSDGYVVHVRTTVADEIVGVLRDEDDVSLNGDIFLDDPRVVRYNDDGDTAGEDPWNDGALVKSHEVAHIEFKRLSNADITPARESEQKTPEETIERADGIRAAGESGVQTGDTDDTDDPEDADDTEGGTTADGTADEP